MGKFLSLQKSIRSNPDLITKIKSKIISVIELVNMRPEALCPDGLYDFVIVKIFTPFEFK